MDNDVVDDQPTSDRSSVTPAPDDRKRRTMLVVLAAAATVVGLDLLTKSLAVAFLEKGEPVEIIGDVVTLRLVRNSGAAFSMASGYTWILSIVALAVVAAIVRYSGRLRSAWWVLGLSLVLGGAIGNLVDRIFRAPKPLQGHVVDFVSVGWWPVFNVADSAVVCGAILLVVLSVLGFDYDGSRAGWAARHDRDPAPDADDPDAPAVEEPAGGDPATRDPHPGESATAGGDPVTGETGEGGRHA